MKNILIVDDNPQDLYLLQTLLKRHGYGVTAAANGAEALEKARSVRPDMIISDILMPTMDGFALCRAWKGDDRLKDVPFVFYTATYTDAKDEEFALGLGADRFIGKPQDQVVFLGMIEEVFSGHKAGRLAAPSGLQNDEAAYFREYNETLIRKLEDKMVQVEEANRRLKCEAAERKQVEQALRESERKYRVLVANADEAIFIAQDEIVKFPNPKVLEMTGYSTEELAGVPFTNLIHPEDRGTVQERHIDRLRGGNPPETYPFRIMKKTGEEIWAQLAAELIDWEGKPGVLCFLRDITKERNLEAQLLQAQKMEAVGNLAGGIAHDFNNLLTVTIGYCDLALARLGALDPLRRDLEEIRKSSDRCAMLTRQLLAFSRKQILVPKVINLGDVVADMDKMLRRIIGEDIDLVSARGKDLWNVKADPGQIEQVIANLIINSRDAMPRGGKMTIETANVVLDESYAREHRFVSPGSYVMLAVSDTGSGMDGGTLARIFDPFFTTKELGKGTGLGLSTVYGIVKQSGGHINVYSEPGIGTTFKMYFPRVEERVTGISMAGVFPSEKLRGSETILVVEDEDLVRKMVREILGQYGYTVLEARSGGEAVDLCSRHQGTIHLMLTDVVMPGMNGVELSKRLAPVKPEMKVLFMSGYTANAIVHQEILESGIAFLQKPFTMASLARKVREVLGSGAATS
ncbi:MAG: response regulator [bacterium]|jgi:PAS domain S-box-containing protein